MTLDRWLPYRWRVPLRAPPGRRGARVPRLLPRRAPGGADRPDLTWEGDPDGVSLGTLDLEDLGGGPNPAHIRSLSSRSRSAIMILRQRMEHGRGEATRSSTPCSPDEAPSTAGARWARVADGFGARVDGVPAGGWDAAAPCEG